MLGIAALNYGGNLFDTGDYHFVDALNQRIEQRPDVCRGVFKRGYGQIPIGKDRVGKMVLVTLGLPFLRLGDYVGHFDDHIQQHHDLIEMVQVVGCEERFLVDRRASYQLAVRFGIGGIMHWLASVGAYCTQDTLREVNGGCARNARAERGTQTK